MDVEILSTGDELLTGQVVDTNSTWLMDRLWDLGVRVRRKTLVGDDRDDLLAAIRDTTSRAEVVVMSGGLGATEDDLTRECVAAALGVPLVDDPAALAAVRERYVQLGREMTPNNAKLARFPRGARVVPNRFGTAPAFAVRVGRAELFCLPGVRSEYRGLCEEEVLPRVAALAGGDPPAARLVKLFGVWEAQADELMRPLMRRPEHRDVRFGFRAAWPEIHVKWTVAGPGAAARADAILEEVRRLFGDALFAEGKAELAAGVLARLSARGERVAVAEGFTGGVLAAMLSAAPGAAAAFDGGVVVTDDGAAARLLGVSAELAAEGSPAPEPFARALAEAARARAGSTWGLAVGPCAVSGSPREPVREVAFALAGPGGTEAWSRSLGADRERMRERAAYEVLDRLRRWVR